MIMDIVKEISNIVGEDYVTGKSGQNKKVGSSFFRAAKAT